MELNLQPLAHTCFVTGRPFVEGDRLASFLVRNESSDEVVRYDIAASERVNFAPPGFVACQWVHFHKARKVTDNPERELKLTAENLFVTLADPANELAPENLRLVQFLALMLERKKVLRPKGRSGDGTRNVFEHAKSKQLYEVPAGELSPEFFMSIQEQLGVLVGGGKKATQEAQQAKGGAAAAAAPVGEGAAPRA